MLLYKHILVTFAVNQWLHQLKIKIRFLSLDIEVKNKEKKVPHPAKNNTFYQLISYYNKFASEGLQIMGKDPRLNLVLLYNRLLFKS